MNKKWTEIVGIRASVWCEGEISSINVEAMAKTATAMKVRCVSVCGLCWARQVPAGSCPPFDCP